MLLYFFLSLITLPTAYFAPVVMLWLTHGYKPTRREVLRHVAVCLPLLQIVYLLIIERQYVLYRPIFLELVIVCSTLWAFRAPLMQRISALLTSLILIVIGESCAYLVIQTVFPQFIFDYQPWRTVLLNLIPFSVPYLLTGAALLLRRVRCPQRGNSELRKVLRVAAPTALFVSALAVVLETEWVRIFGMGPLGLNHLLMLAVVMMLSACVTCGLLLDVTQQEQAKSETLLRFQQTIANQYDSTRQFRHNYRNTLLMLNGYYRAGEYAAMGELLNRMGMELAAGSSEYAKGVEAIEDRGLQWLVISKLAQAQSQDIDCAVRTEGQLSAVKVETATLAELLGILLDNAVEAAAQSQARQMGLDITARGDTLVVSVRNSVDDPPNLSRLFDKGFTTKRDHTGLGLHRLRQILRAYPQALTEVKVMDGMFIFTVSISRS